MKILLLGHGKTGSFVAQIARDRGHAVEVMKSSQNPGGSGLTEQSLAGVDVVIDFTTPEAVVPNIEACARHKTNMVVGTTGWYAKMEAVRQAVQQSGIGFVYSANFSVGVNLFFQIAKDAAAALKLGYRGSIMERHHVHKKDAPSGTAVAIQNILDRTSGVKPEITSVREGETVGMHVIMLDSENDSIMLTHDAKSRRGFAEGAVLAAEWIKGKRGFYDFKDIFQQLH